MERYIYIMSRAFWSPRKSAGSHAAVRSEIGDVMEMYLYITFRAPWS